MNIPQEIKYHNLFLKSQIVFINVLKSQESPFSLSILTVEMKKMLWHCIKSPVKEGVKAIHVFDIIQRESSL